MNERKIIYVILGSLGALVPGSEVLVPLIGAPAVNVIQWACGGIIAGLTAWRAYIDQHESRADAAAAVTPPTP